MSESGSSRGLSTLKSLLFDEEAQRLERMSRRIDETHARDSKQDERIEQLFARTGTDERLQKSVANILDGALREAEVDRHEPLAQAIAPLVVRTIKYELKNSQDEMVDALYPLTGRLVKQYVQTAINDMMVEINAKLGGARKRDLASRSASTGLDPSQLALADANKLAVEELFLVERSTGDLAAHWEKPDADGLTAGTNNRDVLISGYISAIMSFSEEAFGAKSGGLRTLTLDDGERIFVRGSGAYLLAVRAKGSGPPVIENAIDDVFLDSLERYRKVMAQPPSAAHTTDGNATELETQRGRILPEVASSLEKRLDTAQSELLSRTSAPIAAAGPSFARLYAMAALILLPLIGWALWSAWQTYTTNTTIAAVTRVINSSDDIRGYLPRIDVERGGKAYSVSGLLPTSDVRQSLFDRLAREVSWSKATDRTATLPTPALQVSGADPARLAAAERAITANAAENAQTKASIAPAIQSTVDTSIRAGVSPLASELAELRRRLDNLADLTSRTVTQVSPIPREISDLRDMIARLPRAQTQTPHDILDDFVRRSAIFFSDGTTWRDDRAMSAIMDQLVTLLRDSPADRLRVIGYTDERGSVTLNQQLAQARAERVAAELEGRGVPRNRMTVIGRTTGRELSRLVGTESSNRRVEFELTFNGEPE